MMIFSAWYVFLFSNVSMLSVLFKKEFTGWHRLFGIALLVPYYYFFINYLFIGA